MERSYQFAVKLLFLIALPVAVAVTFIAPVLIGLLGGRQISAGRGYRAAIDGLVHPYRLDQQPDQLCTGRAGSAEGDALGIRDSACCST